MASIFFRFFLFLAFFLSAYVSCAQYVETGSNYINNTDLPAVSKRADMSAVKYAEVGRGQIIRHRYDSEINSKVSIRFEVAASDEFGGVGASWSSAMGYDPADNSNINSTPTSFKNTGCASKSPSGEWRLPTVRELMLIYILKDKLLNKGFQNGFYWSSTEYDSNSALGVSLGNGTSSYPNSSKLSTYSVRCIRDLPSL